jgi:hypothetical protein
MNEENCLVGLGRGVEKVGGKKIGVGEKQWEKWVGKK